MEDISTSFKVIIGLGLIIPTIKYIRKYSYILPFIKFAPSLTYKYLTQKKDTAKIIDDNVICISYYYNGKEHNLFLPYSRSRAINDMDMDIYIENNNKLQKITHQPGIKYYITAEMLSADNIIIKLDNHSLVLDKDEIPKDDHLDEILEKCMD